MIQWDSDDILASVSEEAEAFARANERGEWSVIWCAGAGVIGTTGDQLSRETEILQSVLAGLGDRGSGLFFLASSAGGVFGGTHDRPISETTAPAPLSEYGRNKLRQEEAVRSWATATGQRAVIGRISNLYGPGQSLTKPQGLISQICLATLRREPITLYVPIDTIRDYLFVDDCARLIESTVRRGRAMSPGATATKILASNRSTTIGAILSETQRVVRRRPAVVSVPSALSAQQAPIHSFRSTVWCELDTAPVTTLASGIDRTARALHEQMRLAALP